MKKLTEIAQEFISNESVEERFKIFKIGVELVKKGSSSIKAIDIDWIDGDENNDEEGCRKTGEAILALKYTKYIDCNLHPFKKAKKLSAQFFARVCTHRNLTISYFNLLDAWINGNHKDIKP